MDSSFVFCTGLEKISARNLARSSSPSDDMNAGPNCRAICFKLGALGCVRVWEIASVSMIVAPKASNICATVDFPQLMPPVKPTQYTISRVACVKRK